MLIVLCSTLFLAATGCKKAEVTAGDPIADFTVPRGANHVHILPDITVTYSTDDGEEDRLEAIVLDYVGYGTIFKEFAVFEIFDDRIERLEADVEFDSLDRTVHINLRFPLYFEDGESRTFRIESQAGSVFEESTNQLYLGQDGLLFREARVIGDFPIDGPTIDYIREPRAGLVTFNGIPEIPYPAYSGEEDAFLGIFSAEVKYETQAIEGFALGNNRGMENVYVTDGVGDTVLFECPRYGEYLECHRPEGELPLVINEGEGYIFRVFGDVLGGLDRETLGFWIDSSFDVHSLGIESGFHAQAFVGYFDGEECFDPDEEIEDKQCTSVQVRDQQLRLTRTDSGCDLSPQEGKEHQTISCFGAEAIGTDVEFAEIGLKIAGPVYSAESYFEGQILDWEVVSETTHLEIDQIIPEGEACEFRILGGIQENSLGEPIEVGVEIGDDVLAWDNNTGKVLPVHTLDYSVGWQTASYSAVQPAE